MTDFERALLVELQKISQSLADIHAVFNNMVVNGLVVTPDIDVSDN